MLMRTKPFLLLYLFVSVILTGCARSGSFVFLEGNALGTLYSVTYRPPPNVPHGFEDTMKQTIARCFDQINNSFSIYNNHSLLSRINDNRSQETDSIFRIVFLKAVQITEETAGAFDISAAPFFDIWGFGAQKKSNVNTTSLEEVRNYTGMDMFELEDAKLIKKDLRARLNMNGIAKGFACDFIAHAMGNQGVTDLLIEIGGEIVCKGFNPKKQPWKIGIDSPVDGNTTPGKDVFVTLQLTNKALATSGNYRNYYMKDGQKYAHTIDPRTGEPARHNLLSATVVADDCMSADAYATAFMVMGADGAIAFLQEHPELGAYLIYEENGVFRTFVTNNINPEL